MHAAPWFSYSFHAAYSPTHTHTGVDIGTPSADRWLILCCVTATESGRSLSAVTVGGESAERISSEFNSGLSPIVSFWRVAIASGSTADIVLTHTAWVYDTLVFVAVCDGEPTYHDSAASFTESGDTFSVSLDIPDGGNVLAITQRQYSAGSVTWGGLATEDFDVASVWNNYSVSGASDHDLAAETGRTITATWTSGFYVNDMLAAISFSLPVGGSPRLLRAGSTVLAIGGSILRI
jgi:hypothetical protein